VVFFSPPFCEPVGESFEDFFSFFALLEVEPELFAGWDFPPEVSLVD
jgi:hypothetical protein